uniref:VpU protein n=1 Tax=Human immunodeficiency virus type 1 group M subtype B (isolate NY5) TaxID=11698 RepID=Q79794_HV1N5|nr:vpU [Human immunodeficiency virus 1]
MLSFNSCVDHSVHRIQESIKTKKSRQDN